MVSALVLHGCGGVDQCKGISANEAIGMARDEMRGMLQRSTRDYQANYANDQAVAVRIGPQTNGYAANVEFRGRDGDTLIALIHDDCYTGWTER